MHYIKKGFQSYYYGEMDYRGKLVQVDAKDNKFIESILYEIHESTGKVAALALTGYSRIEASMKNR